MLALALIAATAAAHGGQRHDRRIEITVDDRGFHPPSVEAMEDHPVTLVFRRTSGNCATELVIPSRNVRQPLPLGRRVRVTFTPVRHGTIQFSCGMGNLRGALVVH